MRNQRWERVEEIYHAASGLKPEDRAAYLGRTCDGDEALRREVESLLTSGEAPDSLLEHAAWENRLKPTGRLGPYEIIERIGAGGMGEVWKARDTRLNRFVAVKTSKTGFSERFSREARAVAALNHPHICTLYDIGPDYLVMELVEGTSLKGPLPLETALSYASQILDALDTAHRRGIVHRDLKPSNILVTKQGIKLLDFGLAKQASRMKESDVTLTDALTTEGQIVGTLQYLSPEQLQGKDADARSDLFAFGCVFYEMITGKRAFDGPSSAAVMGAILERPAPSVSEIAPPAVDRVLRRCFVKDTDKRWQTASDLSQELEWAAQSQAEAPTLSVWRRLGWWVAVGALLPAGIAIAATLWIQKPPELPITRLSLLPPENSQWSSAGGPQISPDGKHIASRAIEPAGTMRIWVRALDSLSARPVAGTEEAALGAFWSPDGKNIGFFTSSGRLMTVPIAGGSPVALAGTGTGQGTWNRDGIILFSNPRGLQTVTAGGGSTSPASVLDLARGVPNFLPDGRHFLFSRGDDLVSLSQGNDLQVRDIRSPERKSLGTYPPNVVYSKGYLLFVRNSALIAQKFDPKQLVLSADTITVAQGVSSFSASETGTLVYRPSTPDANLVWLDRTGHRISTVGDAAGFGRIELSPDGRRVVTDIAVSGGHQDLWIFDLARNIRTRFTFDPAVERDPIWSPSGSTIVFSSNREGNFYLYSKPSDGSGVDTKLFQEDEGTAVPMAFSNNGQHLLFQHVSPKTGFDILEMQYPLANNSDTKIFPVVQSPFRDQNAQIAPDEHWVSYDSLESGLVEVYVQPFPAPGGKVQISRGGGRYARWSRDGKEIFYVRPDGMLMAVPIVLKAGSLEPGAPHPLFGGVLAGGAGFQYAVSHDGQKFLAVLPVVHQNDGFVVVQNWMGSIAKPH